MASNCDETVNQMRSTRQKEGMVEVIHMHIISIIIDKVGENESIENKKPKRDSHRAKRVSPTRTTQTREATMTVYVILPLSTTKIKQMHTKKDSTRQTTKAPPKKQNGNMIVFHTCITCKSI
mmetsp:Transcript_26949/g.36085  ORF Transcript_26949/g.36085 Transcript_26949/m.36085 type:complete len:122 (+) Transcript_26949:281-646(+)